MKSKNENILISTDKEKLNIEFIHQFLTNSYWGKGRTLEQVRTTIDNTVCFGIYKNDEQIGFARVLSDKVVFAYLMDVFIIEKYRGNGFSKMLLEAIFKHPDFSAIGKWFLATQDAHDLYKQFQFAGISKPELYMERIQTK